MIHATRYMMMMMMMMMRNPVLYNGWLNSNLRKEFLNVCQYDGCHDVMMMDVLYGWLNTNLRKEFLKVFHYDDGDDDNHG